MKLHKRTVIIAVAVALVMMLVGYRLFSHLRKVSHSSENIAKTPLVVRVERVIKGQVIDQVKISGTIRPINEVEIYPKISGRIVALNADVGDRVKAGDVLAVIEHQEIALQAEAAKASLLVAQANEAQAKVDLNRASELYKENALAKAQLEAAELKYDMARAERKNRKAQSAVADQQLAHAHLTSLIDGTLIKRSATVGANVTPAAPIFVVQDISKLKLVTSVDAATLSRLKKGSEASLTIDQLNLTVLGKVVTLAPSLDSVSRRAAVEIEVDAQENGLVPNMFIDGALSLRKFDNVLMVPSKALTNQNGEPSVFKVVDGKVLLVRPKLGHSDNNNTVVLDGLNEGDMVAVSGLERLQEGSIVIVEEAAH